LRERIKEAAIELLIKNGYQGLRFRDIAERLQITRANIHYHFGSKQQLADEVIIEYVQEARKSYRKIWLSTSFSLEEKIVRMKDETKKRYLKYNPEGGAASPWSLVARMRLERDLLGDKAREVVERYGENLESFLVEGMTMAVRKNELTKDAPVNDLALQLVAITNSAGPITQDTGSFERLEELYLAFGRIVRHAYGTSPAVAQAPGGGIAEKH
jgi:TetR/AcrR family transcriptional repressor of nem operon